MSELAVAQAIKKSHLPDGKLWENRFEIRSETSDRVYVISQNKSKRHWGCSCPSYRVRRYCKHLKTLGLPCLERPHEINRINRS